MREEFLKWLWKLLVKKGHLSTSSLHQRCVAQNEIGGLKCRRTVFCDDTLINTV